MTLVGLRRHAHHHRRHAAATSSPDQGTISGDASPARVAQINDLLDGNAEQHGQLRRCSTDTPPASDTLTLLVNDNWATPGRAAISLPVDTATINITAVNDAPTATITPASYSGDRADARSTCKDTGLSIADVDAGSQAMTGDPVGRRRHPQPSPPAPPASRGRGSRHVVASRSPARWRRSTTCSPATPTQHGHLRRSAPTRRRASDDADADRQRPRQHRHRRQPQLPATPRPSTSPPSTTRRWRRSRRRATRRPSRPSLNLKDTGLSISRRRCRLRLDDR